MTGVDHATRINIAAVVLTYIEASEVPSLDGALNAVGEDLGRRLSETEMRWAVEVFMRESQE